MLIPTLAESTIIWDIAKVGIKSWSIFLFPAVIVTVGFACKWFPYYIKTVEVVVILA